MQSKIASSFRRKLWRDKDGNVVIGQWPNTPLWGWIILTCMAIIVNTGSLTGVVNFVRDALLFTWAYLETSQGVNYFRKGLGIIVLIVLIAKYIPFT